MKISLQLCGLVITILMLVLYLSHKRLHLIGERVFLNAIILSIICISLDALSVVIINYHDALPELLVKICCKCYLGSLIWVGWINVVYAALDMSSSKTNHRKMTNILTLATIVENIIVFLLPIGVHHVGDEIYTYGPAVNITYVFALIYIISTMIIALYIMRKGNSRRGLAAIIATSLWIFAAIIQLFNNELLLVGFSMAVGIMVLYIVMENPDSNLDRNLGCYNSYALNSYLASKIEDGKSFSILDLSITNVKALEDKNIDIIAEAHKIIDRIEVEKNVYLFKNYSTGLMAVSDDYDKLNELCILASRLIAKYEGASNNVFLFLVKDASSFNNFNSITRFLTYVRDKNVGRLSSTVYVTDDMINKYHELELVEKEIDVALEEDRVEVFYQPICSVKKNAIVSAESLARIRRKDGSLLSPGVFIPVAESTGQILKIGERVLEKVCEFIQNSDVINMGIDNIHVNLSAVQCDDANAATNLSKIVERYNIDPSTISFEITETAVSSSKDILIENMNILTSKGYNFALDDFGKGESNLMYIVEMPIDILKFDMDMSKAYFNNKKAKIVVSSISKMADQLELPIVAEGVESKEEQDGLASEGVSLIQGYYYSKPIPPAEFIEYLKEFKKNNITLNDNVTETVSKKEDETITIKGNKILMVEDNEINAEITQEILEDFGYEVDIADDGMMAVDIMSNAKESDYDLILMDIRMPIMDGYEATRRIRSLTNKKIADIPIIALTAQTTQDDRKATIEAGMNYYLAKPIDINKFNEIVKIQS